MRYLIPLIILSLCVSIIFGQNKEKPKLTFCLVTGKATCLPKPKYPATARAVGVSGEVQVQVVIDENGNIAEAKAVSGHIFLRVAAEKAAQEAKFEPVLISGKPAKVTGVIVYKFSQGEKLNPNPISQNCTVNGKAVHLPKPSATAWKNCKCKFRNKLQKVAVQITVDENGNVAEAKAISGHPFFRGSSEAAARAAKFKPSILDGNFQTVYGEMIYTFNLKKNSVLISEPQLRFTKEVFK